MVLLNLNVVFYFQIADELLADADLARVIAREAVASAEKTLREANETLRILLGVYYCCVAHAQWNLSCKKLSFKNWSPKTCGPRC